MTYKVIRFCIKASLFNVNYKSYSIISKNHHPQINYWKPNHYVKTAQGGAHWWASAIKLDRYFQCYFIFIKVIFVSCILNILLKRTKCVENMTQHNPSKVQSFMFQNWIWKRQPRFKDNNFYVLFKIGKK